MDDFILEERIRKALSSRAEDVHVDAVQSQRMQTKVYQRLEEENRMKHRNWKKIVVAAAAICVMGSISAMALGKAAVVSSYSNKREAVYTYEEAAAKQKGFNSKVKSVKEFSNGYKFAEAMPKYEEEQDANGNTINKITTMGFYYTKNGLERVSLTGHPSTMSDGAVPEKTLTLDNGVELLYSTLHSKFVPEDYVATAEEEKLVAEGKLNLGYGSSEIEEMDSSSVFWKEDGLTYSLFTFETSITADEMLQMAKEVVESR